MRASYKAAVFVGLAALAAPAFMIGTGTASDHADTPDIAANPGTDITDVFLFPSRTNPRNVVLVMNVHPLIGPGQGSSAFFDPNVLYQFKIDNDGDAVEDLVIQAKFTGAGWNQSVKIAGPIEPRVTGTRNLLERAWAPVGRLNQPFHPKDNMTVFVGAREDPFFFDLEQFFNILPDRATPISGISIPNPNQPQQTSWRPAGQAVDFLSNGGYNVLSIVVELPRKALIARGTSNTGPDRSSVIGLWTTTSVPSSDGYRQMDRLARPVVNEVFATVANDRHKINDEISPTDDINQLANDIQSFMTFPAGRSQAITNVVKAVLVPDMMFADLSQSGPAAYLGYETGGATGGKFGGRKLSDDVVDISLGVVFGNTISALGLAPDDGNAIPTLTSDHVDASGKHFLNSFPYVGAPR
jgi:hypothetical protein